MNETERLYENIKKLIENNGLDIIKIAGEEYPEMTEIEGLNDFIEEQFD